MTDITKLENIVKKSLKYLTEVRDKKEQEIERLNMLITELEALELSDDEVEF